MSSVVNKLTNAAERESSEAETLIAVKQLEAAALELVASCEDCTCYADAIRKVPGAYQPSNQVRTLMTDFEKLIEAEVNKVKGNSSTSVENHLLIRQFREAVWNVHHAGQPMPGDEQEDVLMTSTQTSILNVTCPLTGKPVIQLTEPVRCADCRHIYEKVPIFHYMRNQKPPKCPIAGCPRVLQVGRVTCDSLLQVEIDELRSSGPSAPDAENIEDLTDDEDDSNE
uniref:SP-RING-type domain-containing protein n=1 Tax=Oryza barthii TaxID=65489 RepID=A0A0D3GAU1_9ORYZ